MNGKGSLSDLSAAYGGEAQVEPHPSVPLSPSLRTFAAIAKKPSPIPLFWAVTGMAFGTTVAFIIATGSLINGSETPYGPPQQPLGKKLVVDAWQTFTSSKGYSVHYQDPQFFDAELTEKADTLTYTTLFNGKKQTAFVFTVTVEKPTLGANEEKKIKFGNAEGILLSSSKPTDVRFNAVYLIRQDKKNLKLHLESSLPQSNAAVSTIKSEIFKSFTLLP